MKKIAVFLFAAAIAVSLYYVCSHSGIISDIKDFNIVEFLNDEPDWDKVEVKELSIGSPVKYYFNHLGSKEKQAYNNILSEIGTMPESVKIPSLNETELTAVFEALLYDNPYLFFLGRNCTITQEGLSCYFNPEYVMTSAEYSAKKKLLLEKSKKLIAGLGKKSEYETELFIHDYIVSNCSYVNNDREDESNAFGALINGKAACEGYSKAAKVLFDLAGIECYVICGNSNDYQAQPESHMWNIVKIGGSYYHLDLTWDDPVTLYQTAANDPLYIYFNITDKEISKTHSDFKSANPCTAAEYNYFTHENLYFTAYNSETRRELAEKLAEAVNGGKKTLIFKFSSKAVYSAAFSGLFDNQQVYDIIETADSGTGKDLSNASVSYIQNKNFNIIELFIKY